MKLTTELQEQLRQTVAKEYGHNVEVFLKDIRTAVSLPVVSSVARSYSNTDVIIDIRNVVKDHKMHKKGEVIHAVRDVSLQVQAGEIVALVGASGSGKSTLLQLIGGLDTPTSGEISVNGTLLQEMKDRELSTYRNQTVGFVFQFFYLQPYLTVQQNVEIPLMFRGEKKSQRQEAAQKAIEAVGLQDRMQHLPHQLSGGQMQRVAIARAIVTQPKIVLADEPTGNLDQTTGQEIIELLKQINAQQHTTLVIVTHDPNIARHAHRVVTLSDGKIVSHV